MGTTLLELETLWPGKIWPELETPMPGITLLELEVPISGTTMLELETTLPGIAASELETSPPGATALELKISPPKSSELEDIPTGERPLSGPIELLSSPHATKAKTAETAITGTFFNIIEHSIFS
jgi:hypothetical protein